MKKPALTKSKRAKRPRIAKGALGPHAAEIFSRLKGAHPDAHCELDHDTPLQLLMATILSAQCTDKRVNMVTPLLFKTYPTAQSLADAQPEQLEELIKSTGFFRNKTKSLIGLGKALVERHNGEVPGLNGRSRQASGSGPKNRERHPGQRVQEERRRRRRHRTSDA